MGDATELTSPELRQLAELQFALLAGTIAEIARREPTGTHFARLTAPQSDCTVRAVIGTTIGDTP